jgi:hypothetical protein
MAAAPIAQTHTIATAPSVAPGTQRAGMLIFSYKAALHKTCASSVGRVTNADREIFPTVVGGLRIFHCAWWSDLSEWLANTSTPR